MNKISLTAIAIILSAGSALAQSESYKNLISYVKNQGWSFYTDKLIYLKQSESGNGTFTLPGYREYKIFCVAEYSEVTDVDSWVYDEEDNLLGKDIDANRMAIVTFDVPEQADFKVTIKNIKSTKPYDRFECRILVTYRTKSFSNTNTYSNSSSTSMTETELYQKGDEYYYGRGVTKNYTEAIKWYKLAANKGYGKAMYDLGFMYRKGQGVSVDYAEAMRWYRMAVDKGNDEAMNDLGYMYKKGEGVSVNYTEAMRWYRMAANRGNTSAMNRIGLLYDNGEGVEQDYWEALKWFMRAADNGDLTGMYNVGMLYKNGRGVKKNIEEARRWLKKAADGGYEDAKEKLKTL